MNLAATDDDAAIRASMFAHLDRLLERNPDGALTSAAINQFDFDGQNLRLIVQSGIWKPARLSAALTIRTTYTPPNQPPPYVDLQGDDGRVRYKYRGIDPNHADNRGLREAMTRNLPLAYFVGVDRGIYVPRYPVWLVDEEPSQHEFVLALDEGQRLAPLGGKDALQRGYIERLTTARLHQPVFRARVLRAYRDRCAMCQLNHPELLDAAHILPDRHPKGDPVVPNGLSLCKIHHAAYDVNLLGVRRDLTIEVSQRLMDEVDGPMLSHGLQGVNGLRLTVPRERKSQPDPERLELRYSEFRQAS